MSTSATSARGAAVLKLGCAEGRRAARGAEDLDRPRARYRRSIRSLRRNGRKEPADRLVFGPGHSHMGGMLTTDGPIYDALTLIIPLVIAIVFHEVCAWLCREAAGRSHRGRAQAPEPQPDPPCRSGRHGDPAGVPVAGRRPCVRLGQAGAGQRAAAEQSPLRDDGGGGGRSGIESGDGGDRCGCAGLPAAALCRGAAAGGHLRFLHDNLVNFIGINIFLALFNLLPIPPFDGSHIVEGLLPREAARRYAGFQKYGIVLLMVMILVLPSISPELDVVSRIVVPPVMWLQEQYFTLTGRIAGV